MRTALFAIIILVCFHFQAFAKSRTHKLEKQLKRAVQEATITTPKPNETCFAPDEACDLKLVKFIESAQKSLDIAIFDLNLDQVVHSIIVKSKSVKARVLVDRRQSTAHHSLVSTLKKAGIDIRYGKQRGIMHNKFIIVDGSMIETGSFNYTNGAAFGNNENQVYLNIPEIVKRYSTRFEKIWAEGSRQ